VKREEKGERKRKEKVFLSYCTKNEVILHLVTLCVQSITVM